MAVGGASDPHSLVRLDMRLEIIKHLAHTLSKCLQQFLSVLVGTPFKVRMPMRALKCIYSELL